MYCTTSLICASVNCLPKAGILLFLPFLMTAVISESDSLRTSGDLYEGTPIALPTVVLPSPSSPWHMAHFALKVLAPELCAEQVRGASKAKNTTAAVWAVRFNMRSTPLYGISKRIHHPLAGLARFCRRSRVQSTDQPSRSLWGDPPTSNYHTPGQLPIGSLVDEALTRHHRILTGKPIGLYGRAPDPDPDSAEP